jgi:hypothetical protein
MVKEQHGCNFFAVFCYVRNGGFFFAAFDKTRILLENPDTPIERSYKKTF